MCALRRLLSTVEDLQILFVASTVCPRCALIVFSWRGQHQLPLAMCGLVQAVAPGGLLAVYEL